MENSKKFHKKKLVAGIVLSVLFALILACGIYLSDYYTADFSEIERVWENLKINFMKNLF